MATSDPPNDKGLLISGYMSKLSMSGLIKHWNKRFFVLYGFKTKGSIRLEYYDDEVNQKIGSGRRVTTPLGRHMLAVDDQNLLDRWVNGIRSAVKRFLQARFQAKKGSSRQSSSSSVASASSTSSSTSTTSNAAKLPPGVLFRDKVVTVRTDGAKKANLSGSYVLVVTSKGMALYCASTKSKVAVWAYKAVRTYGKSHKAFHFETGRSSEFGPCRFEFEHKSPKQIFICVDTSIKNLASIHRDDRQSAGELRQPPQKERPVRAQSMYTPPTILEDTPNSSSETARTTSIHLENPLQQLKALNKSFDSRPVSFADSRGTYHSNSLDATDDIFWEEDVDLTDFSDMTDFHNSPPSYQDVLKRDEPQTTTEPSKAPPNSDVFGSDPFCGFGESSHSFTTEHKLKANASEVTPITSPTTPPLLQTDTPFDTSQFATSSPNQQSVSTSPFDEFGPLEMTSPGDPWGQTDVWGAEQVPLTNPFEANKIQSGAISTSTTEPPTSNPWGNTELSPSTEPPSSNPWGTTEPNPSTEPPSSPWGTTEPNPSVEPPSSNPWDTSEPTTSPWGNTELTAESPSSSPWGNTEIFTHESMPPQSASTQPVEVPPSGTSSPVQQSQAPAMDPWDFSNILSAGETGQLGSSTEERSNTEHLLQDLDHMTESLFSEIASIQLLGSN